MSEIFDARGLSCPAPVLMAKKAIDADSHLQEITIVVDNEASMENVSRFLGSRSFTVEVEPAPEGGCFTIHGKSTRHSNSSANTSSSPGSSTLQSTPSQTSSSTLEEDYQKKIMIFAATDRIGFGDDELGKKLMVSFIKTLKEMGNELWRLVFVNNGVKLTIESSPVLENLLEYESGGLKIMVCGTCLTHFNLMDAKKVGETTNMLDIVIAMQIADKIIQI